MATIKELIDSGEAQVGDLFDVIVDAGFTFCRVCGSKNTRQEVQKLTLVAWNDVAAEFTHEADSKCWCCGEIQSVATIYFEPESVPEALQNRIEFPACGLEPNAPKPLTEEDHA